jgi:hypothetical protein
MGWKWSPAIAQRISNFLVRGLGKAWVDNFAVVGRTLEEYEARRAVFLERLERYNVEVDDTELKPQQHGKAVGMEFNLTTKEFRMATLNDLALNNNMKLRDLYEIFGNLIWHDTVARIPLCRRAGSMQVLSRVAKGIDFKSPSEWEKKVHLTRAEAAHVSKWMKEYKQHKWNKHLPLKPHTIEGFSDASDNQGAFFIMNTNDILHVHQQPMNPQEHIFLKEMKMAVKAIKAADNLGEVVQLYVDNMPVVHALRRKHSSNYRANAMLQQIATVPYYVVWTSTHDNLADPLSRGSPILLAEAEENLSPT